MSCLKQKFHGQFLGGLGAATLPGYPARSEKECLMKLLKNTNLSQSERKRYLAGILPYNQANYHMHLFESALAWEAVGGPRWARLADEIAQLAMSRFIDPESGAMREFFDTSMTADANVFALSTKKMISSPAATRMSPAITA